MDKISITPTYKTPRVLFDPENFQFELEGDSRPEDVRKFYYPILDALSEFLEAVTHPLEKKYEENTFNFKFRLGYFNSASAKFIFDILSLAKKMHDNKLRVKVLWCFEEDEDDVKDAGEEFSEILHFPFSYVMISSSDD